jgi:hypothetical protein
MTHTEDGFVPIKKGRKSGDVCSTSSRADRTIADLVIRDITRSTCFLVGSSVLQPRATFNPVQFS